MRLINLNDNTDVAQAYEYAYTLWRSAQEQCSGVVDEQNIDVKLAKLARKLMLTLNHITMSNDVALRKGLNEV